MIKKKLLVILTIILGLLSAFSACALGTGSSGKNSLDSSFTDGSSDSSDEILDDSSDESSNNSSGNNSSDPENSGWTDWVPVG